LPASQIDAVLEAEAAIMASEAAVARAIQAGGAMSMVMGGDYESMLTKG
jgi:hypothetical protein